MIKNFFEKAVCFILSVSFLGFSGNFKINSSAENFDVWDGTYDTSWYNSYENEFHINTPEQFAGIAKIVNSGNDMSGKTVYIDEDIYLNDISEYGKRNFLKIRGKQLEYLMKILLTALSAEAEILYMVCI